MKIGISTCPNDTYTFSGLLESAIADAPALDFTLEDIQALNDHAMAGDYDIAKVSFHAALKFFFPSIDRSRVTAEAEERFLKVGILSISSTSPNL